MLRAVASARSSGGAPAADADGTFASRLARFDASSGALRRLDAALRTHAEATAAAREATNAVAAALRAFEFDGGDAFSAVKESVAGADVAASGMRRRGYSEVEVNVRVLLNGVDDVKEVVKRREVEAGGLQRWKKKVSNVSVGSGKKLVEYERRLREMEERYSFANAEAVNRMDGVQRNLPGMLAPTLGAWVEINAEGCNAMAKSYDTSVSKYLEKSGKVITVSEIDMSPLSSGAEWKTKTAVEVWDEDDFGGDLEGGMGDAPRSHGRAGSFGVGGLSSSSGSSECVGRVSIGGSVVSEGGARRSKDGKRKNRRPRPMARLDVDRGIEKENVKGVVLLRLRAIYDFEPQEKNEVGFREGTVIEVLSKHDSGWWLGKVDGGKEGYFPFCYCEEMNQDDEIQFLRKREETEGLSLLTRNRSTASLA